MSTAMHTDPRKPHEYEPATAGCALCGKGKRSPLHKLCVNVRYANFPSDPYGYQMGDKEANITVHRMVTMVLSQIHMGTLARDELDKQVRLGLAYVVTAGHSQVLTQAPLLHTQAPLLHIQAAINSFLPEGWEPLLLLDDWGL